MYLIYLDDILVINNTPRGVEKDFQSMLSTLSEAGMVVNIQKSFLQPEQILDHLGFTMELKTGCLLVPTEKLKSMRRELGKLRTHRVMSC